VEEEETEVASVEDEDSVEEEEIEVASVEEEEEEELHHP
jgi:hypothetical protein